MDAHFLSGKKIVVAGAGMAGLAFALSLEKLWPSNLDPPQITVYERDTKAAAVGREGYSLSLAGFDETGGLAVLRDLGLIDKILQAAILGMGDTGSFKIVRYKPAPGLPTSGIRIARKSLRNILIDAAEVAEVRWGMACVSAKKLLNGRVAVELAGESTSPETATVECDVLIAADGASSKIRAALRPGDTLQYAGAILLGGMAAFPKGIPKPVDNNWGLLSSGKGVCCFVSPCDANSVVWSISYRSSSMATPLQSGDSDELQSIKDEGKKIGSMFSEPFHTIVDATQGDIFCMNAKDKQPFRHDLAAGPIIFIGDSNHAVSPFAGYGANLALKDGWDLAKQLCEANSLSEALQGYDSMSVPRATKVLKSSHWRIDMGHATGLKHLFFRIFLAVGGFMLRIMNRS
ncbi:FAD/NAD(P)-binding domain-containing protein [Thozetella sp. PMI_491]|nr:FAD/NAD(P)-binding domain-containing protein [Thozetella sp. PMI_491]